MERIARFFLFLLPFILTGCTAEPAGEIRVGLPVLPATLNPLYATDAASVRIGRLLFGSLVEFDSRDRPVPGIADWQRPGPRHYRFVLRDGRRPFSNGEILFAEDVAATYRAVLDPRRGSPHRANLGMIERIEAVDAGTLDFFLSRPDPHFPAYLTIGILPRAVLAEESLSDADLIGNGPFRYLAGEARSRLRLERIDDGQVLEFLLVKDPVVRALKLRKGEIHLAQNELGPELADYLKRRPEVAVQTFPGSNFTYLGFNLEDAATGDVRVRRAIAHAIDRDAIREFLFRGRVDLAETLFPPRHWLGFRKDSIEYDPELARSLLDAAGYGPENPLELDYKTSSDPFRIRVATVIQDQLARVGIRVKVKSYDWGTFYGDVKSGNFQMYSLTWVGLKTPDSFRYIFHGDSVPPAGANRGRYRSSRVDGLIERGEQEEDMERQQALYRELQEQLLEDLPYIPLWYEHHVVAMRPELTGYAVPPDGNYDGLADIAWR